MSSGCVGEKLLLHQHVGSGTSEGIPPCMARSREEHRGAVEKHAPSAAPPLPTAPRVHGKVDAGGNCPDCPTVSGSGCSNHPPQCQLHRRRPQNCLQPLYYLHVCVVGGAQRNCLSSSCTGHENGLYWSPHPGDYGGDPLQADSTGSAQHPLPAAWGESTGIGAEEQAAGSPASSRPERGSGAG